MANKPKLGSGGRFAALVASGKSPALAAFIGRKKYGDGQAGLRRPQTRTEVRRVRILLTAQEAYA
jgi:hypothetical protein